MSSIHLDVGNLLPADVFSGQKNNIAPQYIGARETVVSKSEVEYLGQIKHIATRNRVIIIGLVGHIFRDRRENWISAVRNSYDLRSESIE